MDTLRLTPEVQAVLRSAACDGSTLVLTQKLDRKLYVQVDKALALMGGKWNRKARAHLFDDDAADVVADAIATGTILDLKKHFQFFETPDDVAVRLLNLGQPKCGNSVLEPSAGRGALVRVLRRHGFEPLACELWDRNREALRDLGVSVIAEDFLKLTGYTFDRIIANPPFTRGQDIDHVSHMIELLAPEGGRLASVMSPGWRFAQTNKAKQFRATAERLRAQWIELPPGSFAASGTNVNAGIIVIQRNG
jgi:hypothetical protein